MQPGNVSAVVTDDSHFMRSVISDMLESAGIDVIAQARDGRESVEAVIKHRPDVVTMDVEMPTMNGIEAVEQIMRECPTPILMLSAHTDEQADVTFEALEKGAVDFFTKPGGEVSMEMSQFKEQIVDKVVSVASADVDDVGSTPGRPSTPDLEPVDREFVSNPTVIIGASTGGPTVVEGILEELPRRAGLRILVIQHMPEGFTKRFAKRIDARCDYDVREASDRARIGAGEALVATGDHHMVVSNYASGRILVGLTQEAPVNSVRPAVDVTMQTAAERIDDPLIGVVLTGMGKDGAAGIRAISQAGGRTIVQDEATSAVYGMPKRAVETGCVDAIEPVDRIPGAILDAIKLEVNHNG
jgi:two-component system chemotaxis response regulator CheB